MGKGGQNNSKPKRKIGLEELSKHRIPTDGILFIAFLYFFF
jgi:hypothetical protein